MHKSWALFNNNIIGSLTVTNVLYKCKMSVIEGNGYDVHGDSLYYLHNFSVNLKLC